MSCYNWESGTIKIPAKEWAKFRTEVIRAWNREEEGRLERARRLHARLKVALKGKRGKARQEVFDRMAFDGDETGVYGLVVEDKWVDGRRSTTFKRVPTKKDLKIFPTSRDARLEMEEAVIVLCNADRTVRWVVHENNRAVEHARRHPVARTLFRLLDGVTWTRGSGGQIVGNDEYHRDNEYEGGGGNYVTKEYRPLTKAEAARASRGLLRGRQWI